MKNSTRSTALLLVLTSLALTACGAAERHGSSSASGPAHVETFVPSSGKPSKQNSEQ